MTRWHPKYFILVGFGLVLLGVILPILMVLQVIRSTFFLNFVAFISSVLGLFLGILGAAYYTRMK
jgi:amino acid transporter